MFIPHTTGILLAIALFCCPVLASATPEQAQNTISHAITTEQTAQKKVSRWQEEKGAIISEIHNLQHELGWLSYQLTKYSRHNAVLQSNIAELERQRTELEKLANLIDPLLDDSVSRLETFIATDLPFNAFERRERIAKLWATLSDPHLSQAEQLRRVLEALSIEIAFGTSIETANEKVTLNDKSFYADTLRAGRLGYYCISPDKQHIGKWSQEAKQFMDATSAETQFILHLQAIAKRKQLVEVTPLPVDRQASHTPLNTTVNSTATPESVTTTSSNTMTFSDPQEGK